MTTVEALKRLIAVSAGFSPYLDDVITNVDALKAYYKFVLADQRETKDVENLNTIPEVINTMALLKGGLVEVAPMTPTDELWGYTISDLQSNINVSSPGGLSTVATGNLYYIDSGTLADVWGAGNFIALKFLSTNIYTKSISIAILPSEGSGWVELDSDKEAVIKVTNKETQKIYVRQTDGEFFVTQVIDLGLLVCSEGK